MTDTFSQAIQTVLAGDTTTDVATITFNSPHGDFAVEFADFSDGRYYNVCGLPDQRDTSIKDILCGSADPNPVARRLAKEVDLPLVETGDIYVLFETDADHVEAVQLEMSTIAEAMDADISNITDVSTKTCETVQAGTWKAKFLQKTGMDDYYNITELEP